jgi:anti-anti-sigma factor
MRRHGLADSPDDVGLNGHACWGFDDVADLQTAAAAFLAEGAELGQRLMFVGGPEAEAMVRETDPMRSLVHDGTLQVAPFDAIYPGGRRMANADQLAMYAGATDQALADGFTGLRVLAEVTDLASPDGAWQDQVGWESYADRYMANRPLAALCCFDRRRIPAEAMAALGCAHPVADRRLQHLAPFRVYAQSNAMALAGEVDAFSSAQLSDLLELTIPDVEGEVVLDLEGLDFIDHSGVRAVAEHERRMRERGVTLTLRGESGLFRRLSDLLEAEA